MKVDIDSSLSTRGGEAIGRLHGAIELAAVPPIGSSISFLSARGGAMLPMIEGFSGMARVAALQLAANLTTNGVLAILEDIAVPTREDGRRLAKYLEEGFGVFLEEYD